MLSDMFFFAGERQRETPTMTIRGLQRLLLILGGNRVAPQFRALAETTFTRVLGGDKSLIKVIEANAESNEPGPRMARAAMESDPDPGGILPDSFLDDVVLKRKRAELELEERQVALQERKMAIETSRLAIENGRKELKQKDLSFIKNSMELLKMISNGIIDERTTLQYKELVKNVTFTAQAPTAGGGGAACDGISVSVVAKVMGYNCTEGQLIAIGKELAKKYRTKYGENPSEHKQQHNGIMIDVKSYTERDRGMMEEVIKEFMNRPPMSPPKRMVYKKHASLATADAMAENA